MRQFERPTGRLTQAARCGCALLAMLLIAMPIDAQQLADRDGDTIADDFDNCPDVANRDQADGEHDRTGDVCDNCPSIFNPDQGDADGDATGDACVDDDGDSVVSAEDLCASTPAGAAHLGLGCSAVDLVRPSGLIDVVRSVLADAIAEVGDDPALERVGGKLAVAGRLATQAETALKKGKSCRGASLVRGVGRRVARAEALLVRAFGDEDTVPPLLPIGDVSPGELRRLDLMVSQEALAAATDTVGIVSAALDAGCNGAQTKRKLKAVIASIDDAAGRITLQNGMTLALPLKRFGSGLGIGREVTIRMRDFGDGTGLAEAIKVSKADASLMTTPCILLRVAPVQRFPPQFPGPYTLHALAAYKATLGNTPEVLMLERGMRLAAEEPPCSDSPPPGYTRVVHSLAVTVECDPVVESPDPTVIIQFSQAPAQSLAPNLTAADGPVPLPCCDSGTLTVSEHRQQCRDLANGQTICDPVETVGMAQSHKFVIRERNFYCQADYDRTEFTLEDTNPNLQIARIDALALDASVPAVSLPDAFHAEGYGVVPFFIPVTTFPNAVDIATVAPPYEPGAFAIYNQYLDRDFYKEPVGSGIFGAFQKAAQLARTGVDRPSGLRWPRVVGTRNGAEFWYSCQLPPIVRDVISFCFFTRPTLYRWPFAGDFLDIGTSGACGFGTLGHCGYSVPPDPTCSCGQRYAYDVGHPLGTPIYAARGGLVIRAVGDEIDNMLNCCPSVLGVKQCSEPETYTECVDEDPFCTCFCRDPPPTLVGGQGRGCTIGNYLWIKHSDGTLGIYFHMQSSSSGPALAVARGDRIARDQLIGRVGNTGNSSGPHLHFEETTAGAAADNLMRFQVREGVCSGTCTPCVTEFDCVGNDCVCDASCSPTFRNCYVPVPNDALCDL